MKFILFDFGDSDKMRVVFKTDSKMLELQKLIK